MVFLRNCSFFPLRGLFFPTKAGKYGFLLVSYGHSDAVDSAPYAYALSFVGDSVPLSRGCGYPLRRPKHPTSRLKL